MNNGVAIGIGVGIGLILGAGGSFVVCNTVMRKRYDQQLEIELEASKEVYRRLVKKLKEDNKKEVKEVETKVKSSINLNKPAMDIQRTNYMSLAKEYGNIEKTEPESVRIEAIAPEDYGLCEEDGFSSEELYYYADGILANEYDEIIEDPTYAGDFKDHFEEYEDDSVYMRNYTDKIDIHILKSAKTYKEAISNVFPSPTEESEG